MINKQMTKKGLSLILTLCVLTSVFAVGSAASAAEAESEDVAAESIVTSSTDPTEPKYNPNTAEVGHYSGSSVDRSILVRHTGKTSEILEETNGIRELVDPNNYADSDYEEYYENFHTTTADKGMYEGMGFDYSALQKNAKNYAADPDCQNPLSGYSYMNPNELFIGDCNRTGDFDTNFQTYNDVENINSVPANDNFDSMTKAVGDLSFHDDDSDWNTICSNGIGIDVDGDSTDEFAYFSLQQKENDNDSMKKGSYIRIQLYDCVTASDGSSAWKKIDEYHTYMDSDTYITMIPMYASKGYVSLAAGDYDGDGKEELAYYMPDRAGNYADDARVIIEKFNLNGSSCSHNQLAAFHLKDINSDYRHYATMGFFPVVSLATTSTRLGSVLNPNPDTKSAKQYQTFDDLVVSVSVPTLQYRYNNTCKNATTAIYGSQNGELKQLFRHEYTPVTSQPDKNGWRMTYVSACDADLNGDGFKEIFVAGRYEQFDIVDNDPDISDGDLKNNKSCANIITYIPDSGFSGNGHYETVWNKPKVLDQSTQNERSVGSEPLAANPIALCAGRFKNVDLDLKEQVFVNGYIYDLLETQITGKPLYYCYNLSGHQTNYIADTLPGYDKDNFPESTVKFDELYFYDLQKNQITTQEYGGYDSCVAGRFFNRSELDQIAVVTWDKVENKNKEPYCWDVSIISYDPDDAKWNFRTHNNYAYVERDEMTQMGSSLFVSFIDCEADTAVYRWMGSYCSYSAPVLYAIMQCPPYYEEANSIYAYEFEVISGNTEDSSTDWEVGRFLDAETTVERRSIEFGVVGGGERGHMRNRSWSHDRSLTMSIEIATEEDCVVCYVVPVIINLYEVYSYRPSPEALAASDEAYYTNSAKGKLEKQIVQYSMKQEPIFKSMSIEAYNEAVENHPLDEELTDAQLQTIDIGQFPKSHRGDPTQYDHNKDDALGHNLDGFTDMNSGELKTAVDNNPAEERTGTEMEFGYGTSCGKGWTLSAHLGCKVGWEVKFGAVVEKKWKGDVQAGIQGEISTFTENSSTNGVSLGVNYNPPIPKNLPLGSLEIDSSDNKYIGTNVPIVHYDTVNGDWYNYNATSVCFQTAFQGGNIGVFAHSFYTEPQGVLDDPDPNAYPVDLNYVFPPEQPEDLSIQSVRKDNEGNLEVTLIWDVITRNQMRRADGYNIYMIDSSNNKETLHLQNKEGIIRPDDNSHYKTYTIKLGANDYRTENLSFYLAPAYYRETYGDKKVMEGVISKKVTINSIEDINSKITITKQPEVYWMSEDAENETATFSIEAEKAEGFNPTDGNVTFSWKKHNLETNTWETLAEETVEQAGADGKFRSSCSLEIDGSKKESYKDTGIVCIVTCSNTTQQSDIVTIDFISEKPDEPSGDPETDPTADGVAIGSYDDLVAFAKKVNGGDNTANAYLTGNIIATADAEWTTGIGTELKNYNGTFDGRGFCISGLKSSVSDNGGLFGIIGSKGVVKDLSVLDCSFKTSPTYAGGIAAFNYGTIDHCTSGVNLTDSNKEQYNSYIKGSICGGIAGRNKGVITGCRNAAVVEGACCGGITGMNDGSIYGCASNGPVGTNAAESAGGIAGENNGTIKSSYISGDVTCKTENGLKGWIAAKNTSTDIQNVIYPTSDTVNAFGSSTAETDATNFGFTVSEMKTPIFVEYMNNHTDDTVTWVQTQYNGTNCNQGYPIIQGRYLEPNTLTLQNGITVSGMMHKDLHIILEELAADSDAYKALAAKGNILAAYSVRTADSRGNYAPSELWNAGGYQLSIPTNGKNIVLIAENAEGKIVTITADKVDNGNAVFTVADINSFAVTEIAAPSDDASSSTKNSTNGSSKTGNNSSGYSGADGYTGSSGGAVQTGEPLPIVLILVILCALCVAVYWRRKTNE